MKLLIISFILFLIKKGVIKKPINLKWFSKENDMSKNKEN